MRAVTVLLAAVLAVGAAGGCGGEFRHGPLKPAGSAISPVSSWRVTGSGEIEGVGNSIDGDLDTAAVTVGNGAGSSLTIDLGKACLFNMVVIDHGGDGMGFCGRLALLTSMDGKEFTYRHDAPGKRKVTTMSLITPHLARYIRLQVLVGGSRPWRVSEVYVY